MYLDVHLHILFKKLKSIGLAHRNNKMDSRKQQHNQSKQQHNQSKQQHNQQHNQQCHQPKNQQPKNQVGKKPISKSSVRRRVHSHGMRVSKDVFGPLSAALEAHLEDIVPLVSLAAEHAGRKTLQKNDLDLINAIQRK